MQQGYITLRFSWWMVSFPGFLTMAVTVWPCCSAWLTRYCPVCPVAPSTATFILRLWHTEFSQGWLIDNVLNGLPSQINCWKDPSLFCKFKCKKWLLRCNKEAFCKKLWLVIWRILRLKCSWLHSSHWSNRNTNLKRWNHVDWTIHTIWQ